jgi:hypothetical protein
MTAKTKDFVFPTADNPAGASEPTQEIEHEPSEGAIDQGVEESFPASDPVSVNVTKIERADDGTTVEKGRAGST